MSKYPETLAVKCPTCGRRFQSIPFQHVATITPIRTCRGCKTRWSMVIKPHESTIIKGALVHEVNFVKMVPPKVKTYVAHDGKTYTVPEREEG